MTVQFTSRYRDSKNVPNPPRLTGHADGTMGGKKEPGVSLKAPGTSCSACCLLFLKGISRVALSGNSIFTSAEEVNDPRLGY